jgi:hypothetical protein
LGEWVVEGRGGRNTYPGGVEGLRQISPRPGALVTLLSLLFSFLGPLFLVLSSGLILAIFSGVISLTWGVALLRGGEENISIMWCCVVCVRGGSRQFKSSLYNRNGGNLYPREAECHLRRKFLHREGLFLLISSIMLLRVFFIGFICKLLVLWRTSPSSSPPRYSLVLFSPFFLCVCFLFSLRLCFLCVCGNVFPSLVCL